MTKVFEMILKMSNDLILNPIRFQALMVLPQNPSPLSILFASHPVTSYPSYTSDQAPILASTFWLEILIYKDLQIKSYVCTTVLVLVRCKITLKEMKKCKVKYE